MQFLFSGCPAFAAGPWFTIRPAFLFIPKEFLALGSSAQKPEEKATFCSAPVFLEPHWPHNPIQSTV